MVGSLRKEYMKPKQCPACMKEVHPKASICPFCQSRLKRDMIEKIFGGFVIVFVLSFILAAVI